MKKICSRGHSFIKSSDCPVCPICESIENPKQGIFANIGAPGRRALTAAAIYTVEDLTKWSKKELLNLHGLGPNAVTKIEYIVKTKGYKLKK